MDGDGLEVGIRMGRGREALFASQFGFDVHGSG